MYARSCQLLNESKVRKEKIITMITIDQKITEYKVD